MRADLSLKTTILVVSLCLTAVVILGCATLATPPITPTPTQSPSGSEPIEVVSVSGPLQPINPGGPIVEITLKNTGSEAIVSLSAMLQLVRPFNFTFDVTSYNPLLPGKSISSKMTLIGGGFGDNTQYPLAINGTSQNGSTFAYTKQVQIAAPPK